MPNSFLPSYAQVPKANEVGTSGTAKERAAGGFIISFGCGGGEFSYHHKIEKYWQGIGNREGK